MDPITGLAYGRIAVGTLSLLSPTLAARLFLLDPAANPQLPYMTRLFGSREIALGAITLASSGAARERLVQVGIAVDGADVVTGVAAAASRCGAEEGRHPAGARGRRSRGERRARPRTDLTLPAGTVAQSGKTKVVTATTPTTTITAAQHVGREPAAHGRAELAADDRADGDQSGRRPVDAVGCAVGQERQVDEVQQDEHDRGDGVDEQGQHVLGGVVALHRVDHADAQDGHQQHSLGGAEVPAVHAGEGDRRPHPPGAVLGQAAACLRAGGHPR